MTGANPTDSGNGRITTREFYNALLQQNDRMDEMERRICQRLETYHAEIMRRVEENSDEITELKIASARGDRVVGMINALFALITGTVIALIKR